MHTCTHMPACATASFALLYFSHVFGCLLWTWTFSLLLCYVPTPPCFVCVSPHLLLHSRQHMPPPFTPLYTHPHGQKASLPFLPFSVFLHLSSGPIGQLFCCCCLLPFMWFFSACLPLPGLDLVSFLPFYALPGLHSMSSSAFLLPSLSPAWVLFLTFLPLCLLPWCGAGGWRCRLVLPYLPATCHGILPLLFSHLPTPYLCLCALPFCHLPPHHHHLSTHARWHA